MYNLTINDVESMRDWFCRKFNVRAVPIYQEATSLIEIASKHCLVRRFVGELTSCLMVIRDSARGAHFSSVDVDPFIIIYPNAYPSIVMHELVHHLQECRGDLMPSQDNLGDMWKGQFYPRYTDWFEKPWEAEAVMKQNHLLCQYIEEMGPFNANELLMEESWYLNELKSKQARFAARFPEVNNGIY